MNNELLKNFIQASDTSIGDFADTLAVSRVQLSRILSERRRPSPELALKIESETGGVVKFRDWYVLEAKQITSEAE